MSSPTHDITGAYLAQFLIVNVVLSFGILSIFVIDNGSLFKGLFVAMCGALDLAYWCLSRGKHTGNSVERYHRLLRKTQSTSDTDWITHDIYIQNAKTA